ncbi:hypothetical protein GA0115240_14511, partial [Streptomyces sp. DvalAA-14]
MVLLTSDGVSIEAEHLPMRVPEQEVSGRPGRLAIVVAHGFTGALERPAVRRAAEQLSAYGGVADLLLPRPRRVRRP